MTTAVKTEEILHVGCGPDSLPDWLVGNETRLDIDPACNPHIVASMLDLGDIGGFDTVYTSHALEHLYPHEVGKALSEFYRVLAPGGRLIVFVPDLEDVKPTGEVLFISPAGPISGLDLFYGHAPQIEKSPYMAHHTGFTRESLEWAIQDAGFGSGVVRRLGCFNLMGVGVK